MVGKHSSECSKRSCRRLLFRRYITESCEIFILRCIVRTWYTACKRSCNQANDVAGDGTTTATVLTQAMVQEGMKNLEAERKRKLFKTFGMKKATRYSL